MTGREARDARLKIGWSQATAAAKLGFTQAYLSMVELGVRPVPKRLACVLVEQAGAAPTALPVQHSARMTEDELRDQLGALGYPGFSYVKGKAQRNPAEVLFQALSRTDLDARVAEALPWLAYRFSGLDWNWLVNDAKVHDLQNRLGFVVTLASQLSRKWRDHDCLKILEMNEDRLALSRLAREDTFCHDSLSEAERRWLREHRPPEAAQWNLLTDLRVEHLKHAAP